MEKDNKSSRNETAHGSLLACGGGYTIYMAYQMVQNTLSGNSSMGLATTYVLAGLLGLGGAVVLIFGMHLLYQDYKRQNKKD